MRGILLTAFIILNLCNSSELFAKAIAIEQVPQGLLEHVLKRIENEPIKKDYLALIDMSQHSLRERLYLIRLSNMTVESFHVSHGRGSDKNNDGYADYYSNKAESNATSLGLYRATSTYTGKHGLSLRLRGLDETNDNAEVRAIVMHGADYVYEGNTGRSLGCPAVNNNVSSYIIERLKEGGYLYIGQSSLGY